MMVRIFTLNISAEIATVSIVKNARGHTIRAILTALMLTVATQAGAECGNLCDYDWWKSATEADVQAELDGGADVKARTENGETSLHWATAAFCYELNAIKTLIAAGSDVMALDKFDNTPLHYIVENYPSEQINNKFGAIEALLKAGASIKVKNKNGKMPWDLAQENEKLKGTKGYWALNDARYN